jgi:hypothetical protein
MLAATLISCGEDGAPAAKPGPPPAPPSGEGKKLFEKPGKMPKTKTHALYKSPSSLMVGATSAYS